MTESMFKKAIPSDEIAAGSAFWSPVTGFLLPVK
jgi:hypothetical protein